MLIAVKEKLSEIAQNILEEGELTSDASLI